MNDTLYQFRLPPASHWSLLVRRGLALNLTDVEGGANLGMLFYNPHDLLERYNAPDTLKCQHTFKLTQGHCLYSDMGRIFCSVISDDVGWHDTVCGNVNESIARERWGTLTYQQARNERIQNGHDSFLIELAKYGLGERDMAANVNWFSKVAPGEDGTLQFSANHSRAGAGLTLRFEMDTLVMMHSCPHPLNTASVYPRKPVDIRLTSAEPVGDDDECRLSRPENQRGFDNNRLYHLGVRS